VINPQDIIDKIGPVIKGQHPGDVVDALFSCAVTLTMLTSDLEEEEFVSRAGEVWRAYEAEKKRSSS
jgi:hypothetical protein